MATISFSVPHDVKEAFNRNFEGQNKSAVIAELMRRAIAEALTRRKETFRILTEGRKDRAAVTDEEFRKIREEGRH